MLTDKNVYKKSRTSRKTVPPRLRRSPEASRENILAAAEAILTASGPLDLKLTEVAGHAGVVTATVLHHFGSIDGVQTAQIGTFEMNNVNALEPQGSRQFVAGQGAGVHPATNTSVLQYTEEKSNGDVVRSMVDLITAERWFDANEKSIQTQDDATNQAIATVGRTS